jgi:hypothetical protein
LACGFHTGDADSDDAGRDADRAGEDRDAASAGGRSSRPPDGVLEAGEGDLEELARRTRLVAARLGE